MSVIAVGIAPGETAMATGGINLTTAAPFGNGLTLPWEHSATLSPEGARIMN